MNTNRVGALAVSLIACLALAVSVPVLAATPSVGSVQITPDPAFFDTPLTAVPSDDWYDADGDPMGFQWIWQKWDAATSTFVDIVDALTTELATTDTLATVNFAVGDQIKLICTPFDGTDVGTPVEDTITILAGAVVISPKPATTTSTLTATPVHWLNLVSFEYHWQKLDVTTSTWLDIAGATTSNLESTNFVLNDQIKVICTPFDGTAYGTSVEDTVTITVISYDSGVEIKPGDGEGAIPINLKSKGVVPLVIYTTEAFDATTVDIETIKLGPAEAAPARFVFEDVDLDGDMDLVLHFRTQELGLSAEDTEITLTGMNVAGTPFTATMAIRIVPEQNQEEQGEETEPEQHQNQGNDSAPGLNKEPGENAIGKGKNK